MSPSTHRWSFVRVAAWCVLLVLSGCSFVSLGYQYAPSLMTWRMAQAFELDSAQREQMRKDLDAVHEWHRREHLAALVALLEEARGRVAGPVSEADGKWLAESLRDHYRLVVTHAIEASAGILHTIRPEQIAALEEHLADEAAEFRETWIDPSPKEVRRARYQRVRDRAEEWLGLLEPAQRRWLRARLDEIPVDYSRWREDRSRREAAFVAFLHRTVGNGGQAPDLSALRHWALDWHDEARSPEDRAAAESLRNAYIALAVDLVNSATPEQRERLQAKLANHVSALSEHVPANGTF